MKLDGQGKEDWWQREKAVRQAATMDRLGEARTQNYKFEILSKPICPVDLLAKLRAFEL